MSGLNSKIFLEGKAPPPGNTIVIEYTSKVKFTGDQKKRILKLCSYREKFLLLNQDIVNTDFAMMDYYKATKTKLSKSDFVNLMHHLTFNFNCYLYQDVDETEKELKRYMKFVIQHIIDLKRKTVNVAMLNGIIWDSKKRDITDKAFKVMDKALIAAYGKKNEQRNARIVKKILSQYTALQIKQAEKDLYRHINNAIILTNRAVQGTFPYDNEGNWELSLK